MKNIGTGINFKSDFEPVVLNVAHILAGPVKTYYAITQNYPTMSSKQTAANIYKSIDAVCHAAMF